MRKIGHATEADEVTPRASTTSATMGPDTLKRRDSDKTNTIMLGSMPDICENIHQPDGLWHVRRNDSVHQISVSATALSSEVSRRNELAAVNHSDAAPSASRGRMNSQRIALDEFSRIFSKF